MISKTTGGVDAFIPTVAVNSSHVVGVTYYDFRNNTSGGSADTDVWLVRCSASCTNGSTTNGTAFQPFYIKAVTAPSNPTDAFFTIVP